MIHEFSNPVQVMTPLGMRYVWYVWHNGYSENDEFTVILMDGNVRHFLTKDIRVVKNYTYDINTKE